jgi:hypothetical protein
VHHRDSGDARLPRFANQHFTQSEDVQFLHMMSLPFQLILPTFPGEARALPSLVELERIALENRPELKAIAATSGVAEAQLTLAQGLHAGFHSCRRLHADAERISVPQQLHGGSDCEPALA